MDIAGPSPVRPIASLVLFAGAAFAVACGGGGDDPGDGAPDQTGHHDATQVTAGGEASTGGTAHAGATDNGGSTNVDIVPPAPPRATTGCGGSALQPAEAAMVSGYIDTLPYAPANDAKRAQIVDAILKTCELFAPPASTGFQKKHCYAHLAAAIHKESTYNLTALVNDAYATRTIGNTKANDPTVGLLQIRFSSTVHDFVLHGSLPALACVGCTLPAAVVSHADDSGDSAFWTVTGPTQNMSVMTSAACNVPLAAWYYYVNATGNGNASSTTYVDGYCDGNGTAANLITGLRSHLNGPSGGRGVINDLSALQGADWGGYQYASAIKGWFDGMLGATAGTHPFFLTLSPTPGTYCR